MKELLDQLPEKGWGLLRTDRVLTVMYLTLEGYIKTQVTPTKGVYQARLTGKGRKARSS